MLMPRAGQLHEVARPFPTHQFFATIDGIRVAKA